MCVTEEKNLLDHADGCMRACGHMRVKEKKKNLLAGASGGRSMWICCIRMCCVRMPMSAKKKEEKKKLTWNGGMQTRMCCVWIVLHADGVVCGWCCMQMVLRADGVACRCQ